MPPQKKKSPRRKVKKASSKKKKIIKKEISPKGYSGWWIFFSLVFCFFFVSAVLAVYFYPDVYRYAEENENDSASELLRKNVFHVNGKTYVAYREPVVGLTLVHDSNCTSCDLGGLIRLAKAAVPTAQVKILDSSGPGAQKLIQDFELKALPAAFFSQTLSQTSFYKPLEKDLVEKGDYYFFNLGQEIGIRSELSELIDVESGEDWKIETTFSQDFLEEPFRGDEDADVVIVSYSDFECPFCARSLPIIEEVLQEYSGRVKLVFRNFPLVSAHFYARKTAEAAECAHEQDKFWEYHDLLFENQGRFALKFLGEYAQEAGLDLAQFQECLKEERYAEEVEDDLKKGNFLGVVSTPTFFINDQKLLGVQRKEIWFKIIDDELR